MSKIELIEAELAKLSPDEFREVARWVAEHDAQAWDDQIVKDAEAGRLDFLFGEADAEGKSGALRDWPPSGK